MFEDLIQMQNFEDEGEFFPFMNTDEQEEGIASIKTPEELPILALKNTIMFPGIVIPITVGRDRSINAIQESYGKDKLIGVLSQKDSKVETPQIGDLYQIGTVAQILKLLKMPDGTTTAILQGKHRFKLEEITSETPYIRGKIEPIQYEQPENKLTFEATISSITDQAQSIIELSPNIPNEANVMVKNIQNPSFLLNFIASNSNAKQSMKQKLLETDSLQEKADLLLQQLNADLQLLELKEQIESKVRVDLEKQQRDYFLNQQLKTIQEELGQNPQEEDFKKLEAKSAKVNWPKYAKKHFDKEFNRLKRMNPQVAEFSIQLNYLDLMLDLPWNKFSEDNFDLGKAREVLDKDHYSLDKVKDRIIEHLAVLKLKGDMKAPILCLAGPPGVGKTSLGRSIAKALNRSFIRMSLGGLHDESEIRGHRKTYIGAMPGRVIQAIKKAQTSNPVFILDEIDKVGSSFRGDPSSALLEVLDPEQNSTFYDNYLELEYDLSKVMFIATANDLGSIQPALRDRMEIIHISGYSLEEKVEIAKHHLIPKQRKEHGLLAKHVKVSPKTLAFIIEHYTKESGVRALERKIAAVMRYVAKKVASNEKYSPSISIKKIEDILGPTVFNTDIYQQVNVPGVAIGLAWTQFGGDILFIESSLNEGKGKFTLTGNLGDVMKESATTALSFIKAHAEELNIDPAIFTKRDIHIHVPEGAIPKDGPSAGITMLSAMTSAFTGRKIKPFLAMTGEITLRGKVLPVGGIKEKILAAKRAGIKEIILCNQNKKHIEEIEPAYIKGIQFHYVTEMKEVLNLALV